MIMNLSAPTSDLEEDLLLGHDLRRSERNSVLQVDLEDLQHRLLKMNLERPVNRHRLIALTNQASMVTVQLHQ